MYVRTMHTMSNLTHQVGRDLVCYGVEGECSELNVSSAGRTEHSTYLRNVKPHLGPNQSRIPEIEQGVAKIVLCVPLDESVGATRRVVRGEEASVDEVGGKVGNDSWFCPPQNHEPFVSSMRAEAPGIWTDLS